MNAATYWTLVATVTALIFTIRHYEHALRAANDEINYLTYELEDSQVFTDIVLADGFELDQHLGGAQ